MKAGHRIRLRKTSVADKPVHPTAHPEDYLPGKDESGLSPPISYEVVGVLVADVAVGKPIVMMRESRNGVEVPGTFATTALRAFSDKSVRTANSVYEITDLGLTAQPASL